MFTLLTISVGHYTDNPLCSCINYEGIGEKIRDMHDERHLLVNLNLNLNLIFINFASNFSFKFRPDPMLSLMWIENSNSQINLNVNTMD